MSSQEILMSNIVRLIGVSIPFTAGLAVAAEKEHEVHWGYVGKTGPEHWGHVKEEFKKCGNGKEAVTDRYHRG